MKKIYYFNSAANYNKALVRLEKSISTGRFAAYTQQKKQEIWNRLCRYAKQLGIAVKGSLAAACIAAGLSMGASSAKAQTFVQQTGAANPFNSFNYVTVGHAPHPTFVDIDGDGDQDAFVCDYYGNITYYKNTGAKTSPVFTLQTAANNPLGAIGYPAWAVTFVDLDGDGDMDAIVGGYYGAIQYYENTGTKTAPVFTLQSGTADPFNGIENGNGYLAAPAFADVDGDGDMDMVAGDGYGDLTYYENTGTKTAPVFTVETGTANPFDGIRVYYVATPALADIDNDGDADLFVGDYYGTITYYKNTGTKTAPVFTLETGTDNPFNAVVTPYFSAPTFVDIDGDGDQDAFIGGGPDSTINYYENTLIFPVRLLNFTGGQKGVENYLQWQTTNEVNTADFEVERSAAATTFTTLGKVTATGNTTSAKTYNFTDVQPLQGKNYYRLKMVDKDGKFTYSNVVELTANIPNGIKVYPNPTASVLYITPSNNAGGNAGNITLSLKDINGKVLWTMQSTNASQIQADVSKLPNGTYMLEILNTDKTISIQKVIISR